MDTQGKLLIAALLCLGIALFKPHLPLPTKQYYWLWVLDITQSMNVMDGELNHQPISRLALSKQLMRENLRRLPCGSRLALGLFTERSMVRISQPLEVCTHFHALDETITQLDWRFAWAADSFIAHGLVDAVAQSKKLGTQYHLAFFSDGHQAPPIRYENLPVFAGKHGEVKGVVMGVGGKLPMPIPKLDENNRITGYWEKEEVMRFATFGVSKKTLSVLEMEAGYHGRNAPHGSNPAETENAHLSALDAQNLQHLANITGLDYFGTSSLRQAGDVMSASRYGTWQLTKTDVRSWLAAMAIVLMLLFYLPKNHIQKFLISTYFLIFRRKQ